MMNGTTIDKNEINIKNLFVKANKGDKSFLYYDNSKSKVNAIIRKNQLPDFVIEYLWQSKIYKKELIRNQKTLPNSVRKEILDNCVNAYSKSPWTSILRNFLKLHNPSDVELNVLMEPSASPSHDSIVLECWENKMDDCYRLGYEQYLYPVIQKNSIKDGIMHKRIVNIIANIITERPDKQESLLSNIVAINNDFAIRNLLKPVFKIATINDFTVDYLLSHLNMSTFKDIIKYAMHRENISDNMMAKIYLAID